MVRSIILGVIGGLGLFLYGMVQMSNGLKKVAGRKLKIVLETMTKNTYVGFVVGALVTAFIQSSSATSVIVIGLVNAGLLTLKQSIGVIMGSNVGTTATAWLVSIAGFGGLSVELYALPAVGLGFLLEAGGRTRSMKSVGTILLGFGLLFLGIEYVKEAFGPLEQSKRVQEIFVAYGSSPFFAIFVGMGLTMLIQSSSASIAIVQLLAMGGAFGTNWQVALDMAIPFVLGAHVGTTITAQLAALQANRTAKRAAWAHTMFNVLGGVFVLPFVLLGWYGDLVGYLIPWELSAKSIAGSIAVAHTATSVVYSVIFLPLAAILEKAVLRIVPVRETETAAQTVVLERHLLHTPDIALEQARREIVHMAKIAKGGFMDALTGMLDDDKRKLESAHVAEDFTDTLQYEITTYLTELSRGELSESVAVALPVLLHTVNDLERIGDHAVNVVEIAIRKIEQKLTFTDSALTEIHQLNKEIDEMFDRVIEALDKDDSQAARSALPNEQNLNRMQIDFRRNHVQRMRDGQCTPEAGLIFIDLVDNVEKTGDHLTNIAQAVIGGLQWDGIELKIAPPK
ncbi:MAG: Na/Pi cotransporter family protein [Phycisphaerae bacterium]|nr:Na/Pi cotransporter family protein [Phycisphaerae bacterium]